MIWGFCPTGGLIGGFAPLVVKISSYILTAAIEFPYVHRNTFLKSTFKSKGEKMPANLKPLFLIHTAWVIAVTQNLF